MEISGWRLGVRVLLGGGDAREGVLGRVGGLGEGTVAENAVSRLRGSAALAPPRCLERLEVCIRWAFLPVVSSCHEYVS